MKKRVSAGEVTLEGTEDVLTKVLGNPEHRGRVRGQGCHVKQSVYFDLPKQKRKGKSIEEKIQEGIQKYMAEEKDKIIKERDAFWAAEMEKMNAALHAKNVVFDGSPNIGSQQASCSKGGQVNNLEIEGVKKKLELVGDQVTADKKKDVGEKKVIEEVQDVVEELNKLEEIKIDLEDKIDVQENVHDEKEFDGGENVKAVEVVDNDEGDYHWELTIGSSSNVVAYATVDMESDVVHGKPLGKKNARVSITRVMNGDAPIPYPINDEILTVQQAVGTYIAWPKSNILKVKTNTAPVKGNLKVNY